MSTTTERPQAPVCPACGRRGTTQYRASDNTLGCRTCGARWDRDTGKLVTS